MQALGPEFGFPAFPQKEMVQSCTPGSPALGTETGASQEPNPELLVQQMNDLQGGDFYLHHANDVPIHLLVHGYHGVARLEIQHLERGGRRIVYGASLVYLRTLSQNKQEKTQDAGEAQRLERYTVTAHIFLKI